jgi:DNA modification methylase
MAPDLALRHLKSSRSLRVLDPMVGSGTVAKIAHELGHRALGFDTDPLALMIAEAWCNPVNAVEFRKQAKTILKRASKWQTISASAAYPHNANDETRRFVRYWFDITARRQLSALITAIRKVRNRPIRLLLLTALSKTIIVKDKGVSLARDVAHSRPHKSYKTSPVRPVAAFEQSAEKLARLMDDAKPSRNPMPEIRRADARKLPLRRNSVDLVMTSPPYLNAIDYLRGHKLSLVWFGFQVNQLRVLRSTNIGAEVASDDERDDDDALLRLVCDKHRVPNRLKRILLRYILDLQTLIAELHRVLRPRGKCIFVIGDSNVSGTYVRNSRIVLAIAMSLGFRLQHEYRRRIPNTRAPRILRPSSR